MTGNSYNGNMKKGQVLLIVIMLLATTLTVALTATYQSVTETQLSKLEEENQKALAAAEAGIEKALQSKQQGTFTFTSLGLSNLSGIDTSQSSVEIKNQGSATFVTPLLKKDEQYTFYLANYDAQNKILGSSSTAQDINLCFGSSSFNPALEITLVKSDSSVKRYAVNPQGQNIIQNAPSSSLVTNCPPNSPPFTNQYFIPASSISNNTQLLIVRVISNQNGSTRIGFKATNPFPLQGSTIISTAKTQTGVEKKVQLFQSYPQIPAEFFVTSF
jgi:Tfp pilus assembly protein PilX